MNKFFSFEQGLAAPRGLLLSLCLAASFGLSCTLISSARTPVAPPTPADAPVSDPVPDPTATPGDSPAPVATPAPTATPQVTITPGVPDPAVTEAYNNLRTPLVDVTLNAVATGGATASHVLTANTAAPAAVRQQVRGGACALVSLRPSASKVSRADSSTAGATAQPVATVVLTYDTSWAGQLVWVQMLRGGTLTADDGAGHTYDGSNGFYLTLDANAMATFNYQAPNASGTYQIMTRFSNVITSLSFLVPDTAP